MTSTLFREALTGKELPVTIRFDDILELSGNDIVDIDEYLGILPDQE